MEWKIEKSDVGQYLELHADMIGQFGDEAGLVAGSGKIDRPLDLHEDLVEVLAPMSHAAASLLADIGRKERPSRFHQ